MSQTVFGVVGGYGATGRAAVSELRRSTDNEVIIGGRNLANARAVAAEFDAKVSAAHVDVCDPRSLDEFCSRCSIIVNCAGPVMALQDQVAQAAFRARSHYIDTAGLAIVQERMLSHRRQVEDLGLSFVVSAGWIPGISELMPAYANALAKTRMDALDSLTVYIGDSGDWSTNALRDVVWYLQHAGLRSPGYFQKGRWVRARPSAAFCSRDLGSPVGCGRFSLFFTPELMELARRLSNCDTFAYSYLASSRTAVAGALIALLPVPEKLGVSMLRKTLRTTALPVGGFSIVHTHGRTQQRKQAQVVKLVYDKHRHYWINGLVPAIVARLVREGKGVKPGVHFLADAVDPVAFLAELRRAGVEVTETFASSG